MSKTVFTLFAFLFVCSSAFAMDGLGHEIDFTVPKERSNDPLSYWDEKCPLPLSLQSLRRSTSYLQGAQDDIRFAEYCSICKPDRNVKEIPKELRYTARRHLVVIHGFVFTDIQILDWVMKGKLPQRKDITTI